MTATALFPSAFFAAWLGACASAPPEMHPAAPVRVAAPVPETAVNRACVPGAPEFCFNALDDNCNGAVDEGCGVRSGLVQFVAAWSEPDVDIDLEVTDPLQAVVEVGQVSEAGLTKERDCPGRSQECRGNNFENVVLEAERSVTRGRYLVTVRLETLPATQVSAHVTLSARLGPKRFAVQFQMLREKEERQFTLVL